MEKVDAVVIGAGVVGLAIARALAITGREVLILEKEATFGTGISARNSEVIHGGMYYPAGSFKARFCVEGNTRLRAFAANHGVNFKMVGKIIVATNQDEDAVLDDILAKGQRNGVVNLWRMSVSEINRLEPQVHCTGGLFSPNTGIIDTHGVMLGMLGEAEAHGAMLVPKAPVLGGRFQSDGVALNVGGDDPLQILAKSVVISAGLEACHLGAALGLPNVPTPYLCKGNYFSLRGKQPFARLVYPVPVAAGLGVHYTVDLNGQGRFGPDVEWIDTEKYDVERSRGDTFYAAIRRYWPDLPDGMLEPAFAGIRPKISSPTEAARDFIIAGPREHGVSGVVGLFGIESPGLTSSLAIGDYVRDILTER